MIPNYEHDKGSTFWALARFAYPDDRNKNLGNALPAPQTGEVLNPDEHLLCYDYLYYACAAAVRTLAALRSASHAKRLDVDSPLNTTTIMRPNGDKSARICIGQKRYRLSQDNM